MRVSVPLLLAGAGLAFEAVSANPLRVVVVTSHTELISAPPFPAIDGAAVAPQPKHVKGCKTRPAVHPFEPIEVSLPPVASIAVPAVGPKKHICQKMREKMMAISESFAHAFGFGPAPKAVKPTFAPVLPSIAIPDFMPPTEAEKAAATQGGSLVHILPVGPISVGHLVPPSDADKAAVDAQIEKDRALLKHMSQSGARKLRCGSFLRRVERALSALGPWEGRAMAFVLGCGIGVLLRMFWVLLVLAFRAVRAARRTDEPEEVRYELVFEQVEQDAAELPPVYADEKADPAENA